MATRCFKLGDLAALVGGEVEGDAQTEIRGVAGIREAKAGDITFVANPKYEEFLGTTAASAVIGAASLACAQPLIRVGNPYFAYLQVLSFFAQDRAVQYARGVHESAVIDRSAELGENVAVGPFCQIARGVRVGRGTTILCGTFIGEGAEIGEECLLYPNVTVREGTVVGDRVIVQPGAVIGADGFGFAKDGSRHHKVPQIGRVIVEDDVEIGANTCIDRATTGETRVHRGTKIDNLVQVAHNVIVGEDCVIAAQAGISGSTELGRNVTLAGQAGLVGHITIGDNAVVGAQGGVTKSIPPDTTVSGYPAREHGLARRLYAHTARLPDLFRRVRELERIVAELEKGASVDSSATDD
ncbi:MAG: UDP-3-O-(3-hydroxymyristoyl)glucosamine N-acyltransferase [Candidatus Krumholzibacteria bacterium]|nr:UDP-3-O-(3-hydroxymyristoyl)glucosamine N-acyltransferase [Candidatus Krumholzibacteria bacterium]